MSDNDGSTDTEPKAAQAEPEVETPAAGKVSVEASQNVILRHVMMSAGAGLIPLPLADLAVVTGINLKMLRDLSKLYGVEFRDDLAKSAILSLLASVGGAALVMGPVASLLKVVPGAGSLLGGLAMPGVVGGLTYATGRVFVRHFESGGTFLDFDTARFKSMFKREANEGQTQAAEAASAAPTPAAT
jgi:uncharacterized protein (DUF697 family)